jgi:hypothetical protein
MDQMYLDDLLHILPFKNHEAVNQKSFTNRLHEEERCREVGELKY